MIHHTGPFYCPPHLHLLELVHQLALGGRAEGDGLLGLKLDHGGVFGEVTRRERVRVVLHLRSDGAEQVRPGKKPSFICRGLAGERGQHKQSKAKEERRRGTSHTHLSRGCSGEGCLVITSDTAVTSTWCMCAYAWGGYHTKNKGENSKKMSQGWATFFSSYFQAGLSSVFRERSAAVCLRVEDRNPPVLPSHLTHSSHLA